MRRRGALLIIVLLLLGLFLVMGMAFLGKRAPQYRAARSASDALAARQVALAGLEDALVKLRKDKTFPPPGAEDQPVFTYWETLRDPGGQPVGTYIVSVERWCRNPPWLIYRITVVGEVGQPVRARRKIVVEYDRAAMRRDDQTPPGTPNYNRGRLINFIDEGEAAAR